MRFRVRWRARPTNILPTMMAKKLAMDGLQARRSAYRLIAMCHAYAWNSYKYMYVHTVLYCTSYRNARVSMKMRLMKAAKAGGRA